MSSGGEKVRKALGVVFATIGLVSFLAWTNAPNEPVVVEGAAPAITWTVIKDQPDAVARFDEALASAKKACKPVMIDFFAEWCIACKELDHNTYTDERVRAEALRYSSIKIDATDESDALNAIQKRFGVVGLPTIVFIDGRGNVMQDPLVTGFVDAKAYVELMKRVR